MCEHHFTEHRRRRWKEGGRVAVIEAGLEESERKDFKREKDQRNGWESDRTWQLREEKIRFREREWERWQFQRENTGLLSFLLNTIVLILFWQLFFFVLFSAGFFLGWGLKVCVFVCFCVLLFECNARFFLLSVLYNFICCVCVFLFSFSACCDRVCVCVCFCFWWREILFPLILILFSVCECFVFCSTAVITSFSSFSFIYWY